MYILKGSINFLLLYLPINHSTNKLVAISMNPSVIFVVVYVLFINLSSLYIYHYIYFWDFDPILHGALFVRLEQGLYFVLDSILTLLCEVSCVCSFIVNIFATYVNGIALSTINQEFIVNVLEIYLFIFFNFILKLPFPFF